MLSTVTAYTVVGCGGSNEPQQKMNDSDSSIPQQKSNISTNQDVTVDAELSDRDLFKYYLYSRMNGVFEIYYNKEQASPLYYISNYTLPNYHNRDLTSYVSYKNVFASYEMALSDRYKNLDRSANSINRLFTENKDILYGVLSTEQYYQYRLDSYIDALLGTYDHIHGIGDHNKLFDELTQNDCNNGYYSGYYAGIEELDGQPKCKSILTQLMNVSLIAQIKDKPSLRPARPLYEYYLPNDDEEASLKMALFWYRRHLEGNSDTVYNVLNEIQQHYKN